MNSLTKLKSMDENQAADQENDGKSKSEETAESPDKNEESNTKTETGDTPVKKKEDKKKIDVLLKAAGDAPIMKKKKWAVDPNKPVSYLTEFIRKYIKCEPNESLFIYVNQTFVPAPDQLLSNLFECFGTDGKLVLSYCKSQAWG